MIEERLLFNRTAVATVFIVWLVFSTLSPAYWAPDVNNHFFGDANGDRAVTGADLTQHINYTNSLPYSYDTLQPKNSAQEWNTCDINHDRACNGSDITQLRNYSNFFPINLGLDDPWEIVNVDLPLSGNPVGVWIPFRLGLQANNLSTGMTGVPGITIEVTINPGLSTTTGQLNGRSCTPDKPDKNPDQPTIPGAQCAIGVTITDWATDPTLGYTETGPYGLMVYAEAGGTLAIEARIAENTLLDIPEIIQGPVHYFGQP